MSIQRKRTQQTKTMMESKKVDAPTESMYARAVSLFSVDDGFMTVILVGLEKKNKEAVLIFNKYGYNSNQLLKKSPKEDPKKVEAAITCSLICEQQDL